MKLAFLDLPDEKVDLISLARQADGVDIVLVAHPDPDALALKIAEVLQIPRSTEPLDLLALKPDQVALPAYDTPSAAALSRAGISARLFTTLDDLASALGGARADATGDPAPLESWEALFDEATGTRLGKIQEALALSEDRQRLFREVLALAVEQTGAEAGSIMILDEEEGELKIAFADGLSPDTVRTMRQKLGEGVAGNVAQSGRPLIINERISDPRFKDARDRSRITAAMSAPIQLDSRVIGVINVSSDRADKRFEPPDLERLTEIASQISTILERVIQGLKRDADAIEFRARRAMDQAFAREDLPVPERLRLAATRLAGHLDAEAVHLYIAEPDGARFAVISSGETVEASGAIPIGAGLLARAYRKGESFFLSSRLGSSTGAAEPSPNLILAPVADARTLGVLAVECMARVPADLEEVTRLVSRLGRYIGRLAEVQGDEGGASRHALLFGKLADIAPRLMVPHDPDSLLTESLGALRDLFEKGLVTVRLRDASGHLVLRSAYEGPPSDREGLAELDEEIANRSLAGSAEFTSAGRKDLAGGTGPRSSRAPFASVPVRSGEEVVGALTVTLPFAEGSGAQPSIHPIELEVLRKLAVYVGLAWGRSRSGWGEPRTSLDPVTGLLGGTGFEARILDEVKRAERYHDRFLLTLCSIAGYEKLLQRHGSEWADALLREFAQALTKNVREVDAVGRIGAGRFAVLSPETEKNSGALLKRLDHLLPRLTSVQSLSDPDEVRLVGRQYTYPDEVPTGGEILSLIRSTYGAS